MKVIRPAVIELASITTPPGPLGMHCIHCKFTLIDIARIPGMPKFVIGLLPELVASVVRGSPDPAHSPTEGLRSLIPGAKDSTMAGFRMHVATSSALGVGYAGALHTM